MMGEDEGWSVSEYLPESPSLGQGCESELWGTKHSRKELWAWPGSVNVPKPMQASSLLQSSSLSSQASGHFLLSGR